MFTKGSNEAKEFMARIRSMRKGSKATVTATIAEPEAVVSGGRRGRLVKCSPEAKAYMASIRPKK